MKPLAQELKVAHPAMLKAITACKKKNDKVDARTITDLLRCNLLPECYMAPCAIRDLRRVLRYRNLVVRQATRMKNRIAGLLMETGTIYNKERLHGKAYFSELLGSLQDVPRSVIFGITGSNLCTRAKFHNFVQLDNKRANESRMP